MAEPRAKKTFRMPAPAKAAKAPPPPKWKSAGEGGADVYYDLDGAYYQMVGMKALQDNLFKLPEAMQDAAGYEMANIAAEVIEDANENYVPVKFGYLKDSGRSDEYVPGRGVGITEIGMWYGGPADLASGGGAVSAAAATQAGLSSTDPGEYALAQHEINFNHPNGGSWKYLEIPLLAMMPQILPRIAKAIARLEVMSAGSAVLQLTRPTGPFGSPMGVTGTGEAGLGPIGGTGA